ncbi:MAG TPA: type II toxin-antitoxin system RatA family toxin [Magnetospirillum sp.]|nr:type II toxin-antitoxin system RatA family toxin [Magnetospirillum sp.]
MQPVAGRVAADFPDLGPERLFALAADIEAYPHFIPWCRRARILSRDGEVWRVDNHFGAGPLDAGFETRALVQPSHRIEITTDQAPFQDFRLTWTFEALPEGGGRVVAEYQVTLRSPLLHGLAHFAMAEAARKIVARFRERAAELYGCRA